MSTLHKLLGAGLLLGLMAACGGHDHDETPPATTTPPPGGTATAPPDAFTAQVAKVVAITAGGAR